MQNRRVHGNGKDGHAPPSRVAEHVAAFNAAVQSGEWRSFAAKFAGDATLTFVGVPAGPFVGRAAVAAAYIRQPPSDTISSHEVDTDGYVDRVRFAWSAGGTGSMRLSWRDGLITDLQVTFDDG
jgi:steroid delta-isomerase